MDGSLGNEPTSWKGLCLEENGMRLRGYRSDVTLGLVCCASFLSVGVLAMAAPKPATRPAAKPGAGAAKKPPPATAPAGLKVLSVERRVEVEAVVSKREHDDVLKGAIEFLLVSKGGKAYESVFLTEVKAEPLDRALKQIGLKPGAPPNAPEALPTGPGVTIHVHWKADDGKEQQAPVEEMVLDVQTGKPLSGLQWAYTGSKWTEDPATNKRVLMASQTNNLVSTHREDPTVLLMNPRPEASGKRYKRNEGRLPKEGTRVRLVFAPAD
jgi:hypothetical protein